MASYPAPTQTLPIFAPSVFKTNDIPLTIDEGEKYFITYPTAQGAITIPNLTSGDINSTTMGVDTLTINSSGTLNVAGVLNIDNPSSKATIYGYGTTLPTGTGQHNSAFGYQAAPGFNALGTNGGNSAFGALSLFSIADGALNNTAIGHNALYGLTIGERNTCIGTATQSAPLITDEDDNTLIGYNAKSEVGVSGSTAIGSGSYVNANNQVVLGTTATTIRYNIVSPLYTTFPTTTNANIGYVLPGTLTATFTAGASWFSQSVPTGVWSILVVANATISSGSFSTLEITIAGQSPAAVVHKVFPTTTSATNGYYYYSGIWVNKVSTSQLLTAKITTALTGGAFVASTAYSTLTRIA